MIGKTRLELTWIGKDERPRLEPRILIEEPEKSYHTAIRGKGDIFNNMLIKGDNLLALKSLERELSNSVKCIFIDPPYNTGSAFIQYEDGIEHSLWLSLMRDRLEIIQRLLSPDGSLWMTIDDNEAHYLKVLCDEIFGRANFVANVVWQKKSSPQANATWLSDSHDHVLVFAKDKSLFRPNKLVRTDRQNAIYKQSDQYDGIDDSGNWYGRGPWFPGDFTLSLSSGQRGKQFAKTGESENIYPIETPSGRTVLPAKGRAWAYVRSSFERLNEDHRVHFGKDGSSKPTIKRFLSEIENDGVVAMTTWHYSEVGENRTAAQEVKAFNEQEPFATPKPERLISRVLELSTKRGDLVLDSFAGSGTTGAVAHKMGRRWIMIELGQHSDTHIVPRLRKVIDGVDLGGITEVAGWKGGGGFRYYHLASSLIETDRWGNAVISQKYNPAMLAEAMCKHLGFTYAPSSNPREYWRHGYSSERDFIFVTTTSLTASALRGISEDVGPDQTLLVCCKAFDAKVDSFNNLTLKKIPQAVLANCEWGKDDYSLTVSQLPEREEDEPQPKAGADKTIKNKRKPADDSPSLFDKDE